MNQTKICTKCKQEKSVNEFYKRKASKDGLHLKCKSCVKHYALENKDYIKIRRRQHYIDHKEKENLSSKQYHSKHRPEILKKLKKHRVDNSQYFIDYRLNHKEEKKTQSKQYYIENKSKIISSTVKRNVHRYNTDPIFKLIKIVRSRITAALKTKCIKKPLHSMELVNCTVLEYQTYIKSHLHSGMLYDNTAQRKWVQHHLLSFDSVDLKDIEQLKKVCHYTNIVPMWADEHKEFHKKYGSKTNKEQYDEFMKGKQT